MFNFNPFFPIQVQSVLETLHRNGHQLVNGNSVVALRQFTGLHLVSDRSYKYSARCNHLFDLRLER